MKIRIDDYCIRCGLCVDIYPDLFKRNYEIHTIDVLYDEIPKELERRAAQAARDCAVTAMKLRDLGVESKDASTRSETFLIDTELCEGCAVCAASCPKQCISVLGDDTIFFSSEGCIECSKCVGVCPAQAVKKAE